ncbi:MAG: response regulator [Clostridia bacterium]|nr:response regulator [Clostridia bacterium]
MNQLLIAIGSVLMVLNIVRFVQFWRRLSQRGQWERESLYFHVPLALLVAFLAGYAAVALIGDPGRIVALILLGGSVFVFLIVLLLERTADKIQHNEELLSQLRVAEEASKAKTCFLSNMSHDIRTPLNAVIGFTTLARRDGNTPEETADCLDKIQQSGQMLLGIINDVLDMSRIESGKLELECVPTQLTTLLDGLSSMFSAQMAEKRITYTVTGEDIPHPWVSCDANRLNRVLMNLVGNACKFTPEGGTVSVSLSETGTENGKGIYEFRVKDNGIGMSEDFAERLFEPFEREKTSTVSGIQGTGLGLSITKGLVDRMGGDIQVETAQGKGTCFTITLTFPLTEAAPAVPESAAQTDFYGKRLLLAEDNPINREIATLILEDLGFVLDTAENGRQAVEMLQAAEPGHYSAVLMDIQMPVMNGYDAARAIRALPDPALAGIPVIAMTANAFQEDVQQAKNAGMNGHIAKPLQVETMVKTLSRVL